MRIGEPVQKGPRQSVGRGPRKSAGSFAGQVPPSGCDDVAALGGKAGCAEFRHRVSGHRWRRVFRETKRGEVGKQ